MGEGGFGVCPEVLEDSIDRSVVLDHLLMMAAALFMGTRADKFAHDPVEMPLTTLLLFTLYHLTELHQKLHVFPIFLLSPVGGGELFLNWRAVIKTINDLLGPEHPRLKFGEFLVEGGRFGSVLGGLINILLAAVTHFWCLIILLKWKILLKLKSIQKIRDFFAIKHHKHH